MDLHLRNGVFIVKCSFEERLAVKKHGFRWSDDWKAWYTPDPAVAVRLRSYATDEASNYFATSNVWVKPWSMPLPPPPAGLALQPFQPEPIRFALSRNKSYLRLDPGLGKGVCATQYVTAAKAFCVYVTPPSLVENVRAEFERWAPQLHCLALWEFAVTLEPCNVLIVPENQLANEKYYLETLLEEWRAWRDGADTEVLIVDEAHHFNHETAKRTKALFKLLPRFDRLVFMSGTPMPNRPIELWPLLFNAVPGAIGYMSKFDYGRRYCAGFKGKWGWNFSGASNMEELNRRLVHPAGNFMYRLTKDELDLPEKIEEVVVLSAEESPRLATMEKGLGARYSKVEDLIRAAIVTKVSGEDPEHIATYRRLLGKEKVKPAVEYIEMVLSDTTENVIVFAYHKEVIADLKVKLAGYGPVVINGDTPVATRLDLVNQFQKGPKRLIIGNYMALGHGFTITKADREIFVEYDWVPGINQQASDRAHRVGRVGSVLVQYMVMKNSLDKRIVESLLTKGKAIKHI